MEVEVVDLPLQPHLQAPTTLMGILMSPRHDHQVGYTLDPCFCSLFTFGGGLCRRSYVVLVMVSDICIFFITMYRSSLYIMRGKMHIFGT